MTLCIAAICTHEDRPAIVLCSDWRSETGDVAGGDVQDKLSWIVPRRFAVLKAGIITEADRLAEIVKTTIERMPVALSAESVRPALDLAMQAHRWVLIDQYLQARLGINYAALIAGMKTSTEPDASTVFLPGDFINEKLHEIENLPIPNCQLIITGFAGTTPIVAVVNEPADAWSNARTRLDTNFAAIGSGAPAALISLYRREHTAPNVPLMKAAYNVYEAKLIGEVSPGVGDATSITVLLSNGECWDLTTAGHKYLGERYDYFGPLRYGRKRTNLKAPFFELKKKYFEPYEFPWQKAGTVPSDVL
jgi:hypothetical protein